MMTKKEEGLMKPPRRVCISQGGCIDGDGGATTSTMKYE